MTEKKSQGAGTAALEGFEVLARSSEGEACVMVIQQVLKHPQIFVFGELLEVPNIQNLAKIPNCKQWLDLLRIFAYKTYMDYKANATTLPSLGVAETTKLKQLSIVSLAAKNKFLQYDVLMRDLEVGTVRELEDLIIESIYAGLVKGSLDQKRGLFEVQFAIGRDIGPEDVGDMMKTFESWMAAAAATQKHLEGQVKSAEERQKAAAAEEAELTKQKEEVMTKMMSSKKGDSGGVADSVGGMIGNVMGMMGAGGQRRNRGPKRMGNSFRGPKR